MLTVSPRRATVRRLFRGGILYQRRVEGQTACLSLAGRHGAEKSKRVSILKSKLVLNVLEN